MLKRQWTLRLLLRLWKSRDKRQKEPFEGHTTSYDDQMGKIDVLLGTYISYLMYLKKVATGGVREPWARIFPLG